MIFPQVKTPVKIENWPVVPNISERSRKAIQLLRENPERYEETYGEYIAHDNINARCALGLLAGQNLQNPEGYVADGRSIDLFVRDEFDISDEGCEGIWQLFDTHLTFQEMADMMEQHPGEFFIL